MPISGGPILSRANEASGFTEGVLGYGFSPDGKDVLIKENINCLACYSGDVFVMPVAAGAPRQLTFGDGVDGDPFWQPKFSQDGSRLLFLGTGFNRPVELFNVPLNGSSLPTRLNNSIPLWYDHVRADWKYRPGGNEVLYVAPHAGGTGYNLFRVDASGGAPQRINLSDSLHFWTTGTNSFAIDAAGDRVAYGIDRGPAGRRTVMSRQIAGGPEIELTPTLAQHDEVRLTMHDFAQDHVVFEADFNHAYRYELYVAPVDGGPAENITADYSYLADSAVVAPNGDAVIFTSYADSVWPPYPDTGREVLLYNFATGSTRSLGEYPSSSNLQSIQFNAAGDHFIMQGGAVYPPKLFTAAGEFVRSLDEGIAQFHPDGEHVFFFGNQPGSPTYRSELFMERLDGVGDPVHLSNDPFGGPGVYSFTLGNDGKTLVYARTEFGRPLEIYAVSLVPEPGMAVFAAAAVCFSGTRRRRS